MLILVTRPQPEAEALAKAVRARGHTPLLAPLLRVEPVDPGKLDLEGVQALALTSATAITALLGQTSCPSALVSLPVFAVGEATAACARAAGWTRVFVAAGDARSLGELIAAQSPASAGRILHLAGADVRPGLEEPLERAGIPLERRTVYRTVAADDLPDAVVEALGDRTLDGVTLFSPRTAATFAALVEERGLTPNLDRTIAFCLSPAVAAACSGIPFAQVEIAASPRAAAILELLDGVGRRC